MGRQNATKLPPKETKTVISPLSTSSKKKNSLFHIGPYNTFRRYYPTEYSEFFSRFLLKHLAKVYPFFIPILNYYTVNIKTNNYSTNIRNKIRKFKAPIVHRSSSDFIFNKQYYQFPKSLDSIYFYKKYLKFSPFIVNIIYTL